MICMLTFECRRFPVSARGDNARITLTYFVFSLITENENCAYVGSWTCVLVSHTGIENS